MFNFFKFKSVGIYDYHFVFGGELYIGLIL